MPHKRAFCRHLSLSDAPPTSPPPPTPLPANPYLPPPTWKLSRNTLPRVLPTHGAEENTFAPVSGMGQALSWAPLGLAPLSLSKGRRVEGQFPANAHSLEITSYHLLRNTLYFLSPPSHGRPDDPARHPLLSPLYPLLSPPYFLPSTFLHPLSPFSPPATPFRESTFYAKLRSGMRMNNKVQLLDTHCTRWYCSGIHV